MKKFRMNALASRRGKHRTMGLGLPPTGAMPGAGDAGPSGMMGSPSMPGLAPSGGQDFSTMKTGGRIHGTAAVKRMDRIARASGGRVKSYPAEKEAKAVMHADTYNGGQGRLGPKHASPTPYAKGGKVKGTVININVAPSQGQKVPVPLPIGAPPGPPIPPGMPAGLPPGPPPGAGMGGPGGPPPMRMGGRAFAKGGAVKMNAGAGGGAGRLEKIGEHPKLSRKRGGAVHPAVDKADGGRVKKPPVHGMSNLARRYKVEEKATT